MLCCTTAERHFAPTTNSDTVHIVAIFINVNFHYTSSTRYFTAHLIRFSTWYLFRFFSCLADFEHFATPWQIPDIKKYTVEEKSARKKFYFIFLTQHLRLKSVSIFQQTSQRCTEPWRKAVLKATREKASFCYISAWMVAFVKWKTVAIFFLWWKNIIIFASND